MAGVTLVETLFWKPNRGTLTFQLLSCLPNTWHYVLELSRTHRWHLHVIIGGQREGTQVPASLP